MWTNACLKPWTTNQTVLKSIYGESKNTCTNNVDFGDRIETDKTIIAQRLNNYFVESIEDICKSIPLVDFSEFLNQIPQATTKFTLSEISNESLLLYARETKDKKQNDNLTGKVILDALQNSIFRENLLEIFNKSITTCVIPKYFKISTVIPIPKVQSSIKCEDKRAINTLPVLNSILEKIVKNQIVDYFEDNNLLIDEQHGFRKNHSCETALNIIINEWKKEVDSGKFIIVVSIDFKRAFETISRDLFLKKCQKYGFSDCALKWFDNYLKTESRKPKWTIIHQTKSKISSASPKGQSCHAFYL